mgnify:FL=1
MTIYVVNEIVTPGYIIDRGEFDNPEEAKHFAMRQLFVEVHIPEENINIKEVPL